MGSGHFVVAMFERLVALRLAEGEQLEAAAVAAVIERNLFGLEIDPRCTQIAAFNLALAAWRRVGHCKLPAVNLACSGLAPNTREAYWLAMAGDNERLRNGMERLYRLFQKASVLGSLINPRAAEDDLLVSVFHELQPLLEQELAQESQDETAYEMAVTARGLAKAAEILAGQFTLVATNVPYLMRRKQDDALQVFCTEEFPNSKNDLATVFIERGLSFLSRCGSQAIVTPQNWLFLGSYEYLRSGLLKKRKFNFVACLGAKGFRTPMWDFNVALLMMSADQPLEVHPLVGVSVESIDDPSEKAHELTRADVTSVSQESQLRNPAAALTFSAPSGLSPLSHYAYAPNGSHGGDSPRHRRPFWEFSRVTSDWRPFQGTFGETRLYAGREHLFSWFRDGCDHCENPSAYIKGEDVFGKQGVVVSMMGALPSSIYSGEMFDISCTPIVPNDRKHLPAVWAYCSSPEYHTAVRRIDQALKVTNATLAKVPFDLAHWQKVAGEKYPDGLPKPFSSDPTQWLFNGHPKGADQALHVAVARLLGYQWPRQTGSSFPDCPALEADGLESLADQACIVCLSPIRGEAAAADRLRSLLATAFGHEWSNAKERELLLETAVANDASKSAADLGDWLRQSFFAEHCKLCQSRPFIWQIWDGNPHGFSALVNYHRLAAPNGQGRKTLEQLTYTYLGDWIDRQKLDQSEGINGADDRLAAALDLQTQLKKILDGEPPYDLFVRWKPLHQQAIGWDPDINDGVRLNIRPFLTAQLRKGGKAGAGILRAKPGTIMWAKDRGKEPMRSKEEFPWFWGWEEANPAVATDFGAPIPGAPSAGDSIAGNRWNDLHYSRAAKEPARARHAGGHS
jgi:hypothetical protein